MKSKKSVHFIGIGGIGMSSLARWFKHRMAISGSDLTESGITQELRKDGFKVKIGHKKGTLRPKTDLLIHSQAIKSDNPELMEARHRKIKILSYPEAIGELTKNYKTVAIAGAHGKSTTTALIALILKNGGLDPTVIIGTKLKEFGNSNFRNGKSNWLVLEADEYGNAFRHYSPFAAIVTNIDREHLDTYGNLNGVKNAFLNFLSNVSENGFFILNRDNKNLFSLKNKIARIAARKKIKTIWYSVGKKTLAVKVKKHLQIPGAHNLSNAIAAYNLGKALRIPEPKILSALGSYRGAWRRMEYRGILHSQIPNSKFHIPVFDDYAHHPTEIKATLQAFREKFPRPETGRGSLRHGGAAESAGWRIICVFQPHQSRRLKALFADFVHAFSDADAVVILPTYQVAGRDRDMKHETRNTLSKKLAKAIHKKYPRKPVFYLPRPARLKSFLNDILNSKFHIPNSGILVMMGAGDIVNYTSNLLS